MFGPLLLAACGQSASDAPLEATLGGQPARGRLVIHVDDDAAPGGDGSGRFPFDDIADAVALAESSGGAAIVVEPGRYEVSSTIRIQSPIDLKGSNVMEVGVDGWPTGSVTPGTESIIVGTAALGTQPLVSVGRDDSGVLRGVGIRGLAFEAGPGGGEDVVIIRTQDYSVKNNVITGPARVGVFSIASSGKIVGNYLSVDTTGAIVTAGTPASPANVEFIGNRSARNGLGGLFLNGSAFGVPETGDQLQMVVRGNDLSEHSETPLGFGLRVVVIRRDLGVPGDSQSTGNVKATVQGNRIVDNAIGVIVDAGFPYRRVGEICDPRVYSGTIDLELRGNTLSGSRRTPALISFTRVTTAVNQLELPAWQYLHSTTYDISDVDGALAGAWIDHPELDPYVGPCPNDSTREALDNTLIYNGAVLANMRSVP